MHAAGILAQQCENFWRTRISCEGSCIRHRASSDGPTGSRVWLSHYAHRSWPAQHYGAYHFYGHSHGALPHVGRSRDVGIDVLDMGFGPRTFEELTKEMM